jgi:hypothetical protein
MTSAIAEPIKSNRQEPTLSTEPLAHDLQESGNEWEGTIKGGPTNQP